MKSIGIFDIILPKGHRYLNSKLIDALKGEYLLSIVDNKGYYEDNISNNYKNIKLIDCNLFRYGRYPLINHLIAFINTIIAIVKFKPWKYDIIILFTFDTIDYLLLHLFLRKKKVILIHHDNTSGLRSKIKCFIFNLYGNKVEHIVFCPVLKEYIINKTKVKSERIHVIPHPIPDNCLNPKKQNNLCRKIIISTGYANDESLIKEIIRIERETHFFEMNNIYWKIRSKNITYESKNLSIFTSHLTRSEYNSLYDNATAVVLLYNESYAYRFSGALFDGITNNKIVIGPNIAVVKYFSNLYPSMCTTFDGINDLLYKINTLELPSIDVIESMHNDLINQHSQYQINKKFNSILNEF